jgi:hypothetical protein
MKLNKKTFTLLDSCSSITLGVGESVYYEPECSSTPQIDGGIGCVAGGIQNCRYCGFGSFKPCPTTTTTTITTTSPTTTTTTISSSFDNFIYIFDFDSNNDYIELYLYLNETVNYDGELKIDYSYEDDDGYNVTDISSISKLLN